MNKRCRIGLVAGTLALAGCVSAPAAQTAWSPPDQGVLGAAVDSLELAVMEEDLRGVRAARALIDRLRFGDPDSPVLQHYAGYARYREASLVWDVDESAVPPLLHEADALLARSAARWPIAETYALRARIRGNLSALYPRLAADLGAEARPLRGTAEQLGRDNPRVWLIRGESAMYTPEVHGGGTARAIEFLERAVAHFDSDAPAWPAPTWGAAHAHAWLGSAYMRQGDTASALSAIRKAVELEPTYVWARDSLLPSASQGAARAGASAPLSPQWISRFDSGEVTSEFGTGWGISSDSLAGGRSTARLRIVSGGAAGTAGALEIEGRVDPGLPYAWAGATFYPGAERYALADLSEWEALEFWASGEPGHYRVMMISEATDGREARLEVEFEVGPEWTRHVAPLVAFRGTEFTRVLGIMFGAGPEPRSFRLLIDEVLLR